MKRTIAILLTLAIAFSVFACGKSDSPQNSPADTSPPADTSSPPDAPSPSSPDSPPQPPSPIGDIDHSGRAPYKIAYVCNMLTWAFNKAISDSLEALSGKLNYEYTPWAANGDFDAYINQIYTFADQGYDGLILGTDDQLAARAYEACREVDVAFVAESTTFQDSSGVCIWPSVQQAQIKNGESAVQWLYDNYKNYWDGIDESALGLLALDFSTVSGIHEREPGVSGKFAQLFPSGTYVYSDLVALGSDGFSVQGANTNATQVFSQNPNIKQWFVVAFVDDWAVGATRAAETLNMTDSVLVVSIQADAFLAEMNSGYTGDVYVAACAVSAVQFAVLMADCLVSILDGRETPESIWPEYRDPGGQYPRYQVEGTMITRDTYQGYLASEQAMLA